MISYNIDIANWYTRHTDQAKDSSRASNTGCIEVNQYINLTDLHIVGHLSY